MAVCADILRNHLHFVLLQTLFYEDDYRSNVMFTKLFFMAAFE